MPTHTFPEYRPSFFYILLGQRSENDPLAHKVFILFLVFIALTAVLVVGIVGLDYYLAPQQDRVFRPDHVQFRPSGTIGHTLGVTGAAMITIGVTMYSTRKRMRSLWKLGRLSTWLDVHIFLCLLGPALVIYHSTFKAGGIAAISLWTMLSVVASGVVGRFLYVLIPRSTSGDQLEEPQINALFDSLSTTLAASPVGKEMLQTIDSGFAAVGRPESLSGTARAYLRMSTLSRSALRQARRAISSKRIDSRTARALLYGVRQRVALIKRSIILSQVEQLFYYWHVIHLPFAIIMFLTLAVHIGVAIWLGYSWIL